MKWNEIKSTSQLLLSVDCAVHISPNRSLFLSQFICWKEIFNIFGYFFLIRICVSLLSFGSVHSVCFFNMLFAQIEATFRGNWSQFKSLPMIWKRDSLAYRFPNISNSNRNKKVVCIFRYRFVFFFFVYFISLLSLFHPLLFHSLTRAPDQTRPISIHRFLRISFLFLRFWQLRQHNDRKNKWEKTSLSSVFYSFSMRLTHFANSVFIAFVLLKQQKKREIINFPGKKNSFPISCLNGSFGNSNGSNIQTKRLVCLPILLFSSSYDPLFFRVFDSRFPLVFFGWSRITSELWNWPKNNIHAIYNWRKEMSFYSLNTEH